MTSRSVLVGRTRLVVILVLSSIGISASLAAAQLTVVDCHCALCNKSYAISSYWTCEGVFFRLVAIVNIVGL